MPTLRQIDITNLPTAEDEHIEYKSSATPQKELKDKLTRAASGFWNSGGGIFFAGVDDNGKPDGGLDTAVGRTPVRDWIDQKLNEVAPIGPYTIELFQHNSASGLNIEENKCVIAVKFEESARPPHMAPDHKYYIRAGAHTIPAAHFIVEALWARRGIQCPQLAHRMRLKPEASEIIQLAVLAMTEQPALNVALSLDPLPEMWKDSKTTFPLKLAVLDRATPFYLDIITFHDGEARLGQGVQLKIDYEDLSKNRYSYTATLDTKSIAPWKIGNPAIEKIARSLESIDMTLKTIPTALDKLYQENAELRGRLEAIKRVAFPSHTGEPHAIAAQLSSAAIAIMDGGKSDGKIIFNQYIGGSQISAGTKQFTLSRNDAREIAKWKNIISELLDFELIDGVFERGGHSIFRLTNLGYEVADTIREEPVDATEA